MPSDDLKNKIWAGTYGPEDVAEIERLAASGEIKKSTLASVLYSYATRLKAQGAEYYAYLDRAAEAADAIPLESTSADELDIKQTVLLETERYDEALHVIERALTLDPQPHTRALLLVGKAKVLTHAEKTDEAAGVMEEVTSAVSTITDREPRQAIRLYRALVRFYKATGDENRTADAEAEARRLIEQTGARDQLLKLEKDLS